MGKKRLEVFVRSRVVAYMRMAINETGSHMTTRRIDDLRRAPLGMPRARTDIANTAVKNSHLDTVQDFARIDVNELTAGNDEISFDLAHGGANEFFQCAFGRSHGQVFSMKNQPLPKIPAAGTASKTSLTVEYFTNVVTAHMERYIA